MFVATDCNSNERLSLDEQDPRYYSFEMGQRSVLGTLGSEVINATEPDALTPQNDPVYYYGTPDPAVLPTCLRGCLCGYSGNYQDATVYPWCDCHDSLANMFLYLATTPTVTDDGLTPTIYTTPTNLSLLLQYGLDFHKLNASLVPFLGAHASWVNISEGSNVTLQKGFECFGDYQTISEIMPPLP